MNGDQWGVANVLIHPGMVAHARGEHEAARTSLLEAIQTAMEVRATPVLLDALVELAILLESEGEADQAHELLQVSLHHPAVSKHTQEKVEHLLSTLHGVAASQPTVLLLEDKAAHALNTLVAKLLNGPRLSTKG